MNIDHPPEPTVFHPGAPFLLFTALGALMAVVMAVWLLATTLAAWAVVLAVLVAICGLGALLAVMNRELADSEGEGPADDPPAPAGE